jgi:hypothetical protein
MSGHRRAAVALHASNAKDRQWILSELPESDQVTLRGYLEELDTLGFSYGHDLNGDFQLVGAPLPESAESIVTGTSVEQLQQASAAKMAVCFQDEPNSLIVRIMRVQVWPWQDALMALLPIARRQHIQSLMADASLTDTMPPAAMLNEFLMNALAARLHCIAVVPTEPRMFATGVRKRRRRPPFVTWILSWNR